MIGTRQLFLQHVAQTSGAPLALEIVKASGSILTDATGKEYIDMISGIGVCNVGHCHPQVVAAIQQQASAYMHVMVYGEFIQSPQVQYSALLTQHLPFTLYNCYITKYHSRTDKHTYFTRLYTRKIEINFMKIN